MTSYDMFGRPREIVNNTASAEWIQHHNSFEIAFDDTWDNLGKWREQSITILTESGPRKVDALFQLKKVETDLYLKVIIEPPNPEEPTVGNTKINVTAHLDKNPIRISAFYRNVTTPTSKVEMHNMKEALFGIDTAWSQWLANKLGKMVHRSMFPIHAKIEEMIQKTDFVYEDMGEDGERYSKYFSPKMNTSLPDNEIPE